MNAPLRVRFVAFAVTVLVLGCRREAPVAPPPPPLCSTETLDSCLKTADRYLFGHGGPRDPQKAFDLFRQACELNSPHGCGAEGLLLISGTGVSANVSAGLKLADRGCKSGDAASCNGLGRALRSGREIPRSDSKAADYFSQACDHGLGSGCTEAGQIRTWSLNPPDFTSALEQFQKGCELKDANACRHHAQAIACGRGTPVNTVEASRLLFAACSHGDEGSCDQVAELVAEGEPITPTIESAVEANVGLLAVHRLVRLGRVAEAQRQLDKVATRHLGANDRAVFLAICLDLNGRNLASARTHFQGFSASAQTDGAARVLAKLLAGPLPSDATWPEALVSAFVAAGKPDLRASSLLMPEKKGELGDCSREERHPELVAGPSSDVSFLKAFSRQSHSRPDSTLVSAAQRFAKGKDGYTQWVALAVLSAPSLSKEQQQSNKPFADAALESLTRKYPREFYFNAYRTLGVQLGHSLTEAAELQKLAAAASAQAYHPPRRELFVAFQRALGRGAAGSSEAFASTIDVATAPEFTGYAQVLARAAAAGSAQDRATTTAVLRAMASKISEGDWLVDLAQSAFIARTAAALSGDAHDAATAEGLETRARRFGAGGKVFPKLGSWPLTPLISSWEERTMENELAFYERLATLGAE